MITVSQSGIIARLLFLTVALVGCDAALLYVRAFGVTGTPESSDEVLARHLAEAMDAEASS